MMDFNDNCIGKHVSELQTPCFLVDLDKVSRNCELMKDNCKRLDLDFRPCISTHRTIEGAKLQTMEPKTGVMCRSLQEVEYLAKNGFDDIVYGFPLIRENIPTIFKLTDKLSSFHFTIDNFDAVCDLRETVPPNGKIWSVLLMVDCGAKREGVWWQSEEAINLVQNMKNCNYINFKGVYAFCGNAYQGYEADLEKARDETIERLMKFVGRLKASNIKCNTIGLGGSPVCKTSGTMMHMLTELHAGNYFFNDLQQCTLGSKHYDIACTIATKIVGHYPLRKEMLVDCGENGISTIGNYGQNNKEMGYALVKDEPNLRLSAVYQDLGVIQAINGDLDFKKYPIGTVIQLLPWHACGTSLLYRKYHIISNSKVSQEWNPVSTC